MSLATTAGRGRRRPPELGKSSSRNSRASPRSAAPSRPGTRSAGSGDQVPRLTRLLLSKLPYTITPARRLNPPQGRRAVSHRPFLPETTPPTHIFTPPSGRCPGAAGPPEPVGDHTRPATCPPNPTPTPFPISQIPP